MCVAVCYGSKTWPVKKENELPLQRAEMRMIRWMCGIKITDRFSHRPSELTERLGIDNIIKVIQQHRLTWYGRVLRKDENDWAKKCMDYEVEGVRPRGRPKKTWSEVIEKD